MLGERCAGKGFSLRLFLCEDGGLRGMVWTTFVWRFGRSMGVGRMDNERVGGLFNDCLASVQSRHMNAVANMQP